MNSCKNFSKKHPIWIAALSVVFLFVLLRITNYFPEGPLSFGIRECFLAALVFPWTFLFMGKEKVSYKPDGFGYSFRFFRGYLIAIVAISILSIVALIVQTGSFSAQPIKLLNAFMMGLAVGIVEEFIFRGLVFGGILQKIGNSKKNIIIAAVISGLIFGVMHVLDFALEGGLTNWDTVLTAALKTTQTGIFGIILAFVYIKTRNIYAVAAIHGLNDLILFLSTVGGDGAGKGSYVDADGNLPKQITYAIFTLVMVPMLIKGIKDIKENEALPFDEDFTPRAVKYEKKTKKSKSNYGD